MEKSILVADKIAQPGIDYLKEQSGFQVDHILLNTVWNHGRLLLV